MAIALVQQAFNDGGGGGTALPGPTMPGNFLLAVTVERAVAPQVGPTSSHGTWVLAASLQHPTDNTAIRLWYVQDLVGITTGIAFPGDTGDDVHWVYEYSGVSRVAALDKVATASGTGTALSVGPTTGTDKLTELWFAAFAGSNGGLTFTTPGGGFLFADLNRASGGGAGEIAGRTLAQITVAAGPATATATMSSSDQWVGALATFRSRDTELVTGDTIPGTSTTAATGQRRRIANSVTSGGSNVSGAVQRFRRVVSVVPVVSDTDATGDMTRNATALVAAFSDAEAFADVLSSELVLLSVGTPVIEGDGGQAVTLFGTFPVGVPMKVYIGPAGTTDDPEAYSGVPGNGYTIVARRSDQVTVYSPNLPPGIYRIHAETALDSSTLLNAIVVRPKQFRSGVYALRGVLPNWYQVGPKSLDREA